MEGRDEEQDPRIYPRHFGPNQKISGHWRVPFFSKKEVV